MAERAEFWEAYSSEEWTYLLDPPQSGARNMERDLELLAEAERPTLRLYDWSRPTLSLGYHQRQDWVDLELCQRQGVEVVRRPTGGRALLHLPGEITYSVVLPRLGAVGVRPAFQAIVNLLARSLERLGLPVSTASQGHIPSSASHPSCMAVTAPGEIIARGRKLVGSAQVRRYGNLLQHGSLVRAYQPELLALLIPGAQPQMDLESLGFGQLQPAQIMESWRQVWEREVHKLRVD